MSKVIELFNKAGGKNLLKEYARAGVLPFAVIQFIMLGHSVKSLELLRNSVKMKIYNKLKKKYKYVLENFCASYDVSMEQYHCGKIWFCWLQGLENAPELVKCSYNSLKQNLCDREIIVLTEKNLNDYVNIPDYIMRKLNTNIITKTHFSDILRLELLTKYGGTWIDATVFCSGKEIPDYMLGQDLFIFQTLKPGRDGHASTISSWYINSSTNNPILMVTKELLYEYWKTHNYLIDYGLIHLFMSMALEYMPDECKKIPEFCNSIPHILLLKAFEQFDINEYKRIIGLSCFHKLSDKRPTELLERKGTYYDIIVRKGIDSYIK